MSEPVWVGGAKTVPQVDTITVAGTWATSDTVTVTINGQDLTITIGTDTTTDQVATVIKEAINGDTQTGTGDHTASPLFADDAGQSISEFTEIVATVSSSVVSVTTTDTVNANYPGKPFTMSVTESTAGDGTATEATATTATGPHDANNADNYSTGALPTNSDDLVFDNRAGYSMLYNLSSLSAVALTSLTVTNGFRHTIGLPEVNADVQTTKYQEYRATYFSIQTASLDIQGDGSGSERVKIDVGSATATTMNIDSAGRKLTGSNEEAYLPAVMLKGTNASNILRVTRGDVGFAFFDGESGHLATLHVGPDNNTAVRLGDGVDITNATITMSGGVLLIDSTTSGGTIAVTDGTCNVMSAAHASITCDGGTVNYKSSGTLTNGYAASGGHFVFSPDKSRTVTNFELTSGGRVSDPSKTVTWSNGIDLYRRGTGSSDINIGEHFTLTMSAI
jgi:hypothetical protein